MLPVIVLPEYELKLPVSEKIIKFRPYTVKEEKILLMAQQGEDPVEIVGAVRQLIKNCLIDPSIKIEDLPALDLEYLFIKIRSKSVSNVVKLTYRDREDDKPRDFEVNLDAVEVEKNLNHSKVIEVTPTIKITMSYPTIAMSESIDSESDTEAFINIIKACLEKVSLYDKESWIEYSVNEYSAEEVEDFVLSLPIPVLMKIKDFFDTSPKIKHVITYTNDLGNERRIELSSLTDFFSLA